MELGDQKPCYLYQETKAFAPGKTSTDILRTFLEAKNATQNSNNLEMSKMLIKFKKLRIIVGLHIHKKFQQLK